MPNEKVIPAARITRLRDGKIYATHVLLQYSKPDAQDVAIERVKAGKISFVRRSDVHQVSTRLGSKMQSSANNTSYHRELARSHQSDAGGDGCAGHAPGRLKVEGGFSRFLL